MAHHDSPVFSSYEEIADDYARLYETGAVQVLDPKTLKASESTEVSLATIADLADPKYVEIASQPALYNLPSRPLGVYGHLPSDRPTWQAFMGKIAMPLLVNEEFLNERQWTSHVLVPGDHSQSWTLSYEAGSAAVTNFYLEAAQELKLTPITTSSLHHQLVLRKLKRIFAEDERKIDLIDASDRKRYRAIFGQGEIIHLLGALYPSSQVDKVPFAKIVEFRNETQELRNELIKELDYALRIIDADPTTATYDKDVIHAVKQLGEDFKNLERELSGIRDRVLPSFGEALMYGTAGGGALSALVSFLGGLSPSGVVAASALTVSGAFLAKAIGLWNERREVLRSQSSSVSYLAKVSQLVKAG